MGDRDGNFAPTRFEQLGEGEYFVRRTLETSADYEEAYWGVVTDPDGVVRNRADDCARFLAAARAELDCINRRPPGRLLDVGCGMGFLLSGVEEAWERHGVELSELAAGHAAEWGEIKLGTLAEAAYSDHHFDVVVLYHVIEHVDDPESLICEVRRILRPDGLLILGTPNFDGAMARRFGDRFRLLDDATHVSLFSEDSMRRFLRDHGFSVGHVDHPFFDTPYFTPENLSRLHDTDAVSPPFYGNVMTFHARPMTAAVARDLVRHLDDKLGKLFANG